MREMIERVAKAIQSKDFDDYGACWESITECYQADYFAMASAAIEAMRTPTKEMEAVYLVAGGLAAEDVWPAMIDAALNEKP